jgi:hypothetical protein
MLRQILGRLALVLGLVFAASPGCTKSVCETTSDCPVGNFCSGGTCVKACVADTDCPSGKFCDKPTGLCQLGCRSSSDCVNGEECVKNQCRPTTGPAPSTDGGSAGGGLDDGGFDDGGLPGGGLDGGLPGGGLDGGGAPVCSCLPAPFACLYDINPASPTTGKLVCEPSVPPRPTVLFFGNLGCSHCQSIFRNLLLIESQLWSEGLGPMLAFVQLKDYTYTAGEVTSILPTHTGPVLQDTGSEDMWGVYDADWYQVKVIDSRGCLSALFSSDDTMNLVGADQELQAAGQRLKDAWRAAMGTECHLLPDAGPADDVGP